MQKKITAVSPRSWGHLHLEFEDGTQEMITRGAHEAHAPKVGDMWPPALEAPADPLVPFEFAPPEVAAAYIQPALEVLMAAPLEETKEETSVQTQSIDAPELAQE